VLWLVGPNDRRDNFSNGHVWHWKLEGLEL
jgi:hypothetical protein